MVAPRTPAYNTSVGQADKTQHVAQNPPLDATAARWIDAHFRDRWRAILGVDDMVGLVLDHLERRGILASTYVFFSSDHGYKLGEWRIGCSKQHPMESDVHIPFFARGPGIAPGTRLSALVSNVDIAPTFIDIAGLPPNPEHDGRSLLPMLHTAQGSTQRRTLEGSWRTTQIIEYLSVGTYYNDHAAIWVSGPAAVPGTPVVYGHGPFTPVAVNASEKSCAASENKSVGRVGAGECYFVDSTESNNWIAIRVRNATDNFVYAESFGAQAMNTPILGPSGMVMGKGIFKCLEGDLCQHELYHYGPINASEYPHYPVMTDERWCLVNSYKSSSLALQEALHAELKASYCAQRRLAVDRMECSSGSDAQWGQVSHSD